MIFAPESIKLIQAGVKTMTRRPVKDGDTCWLFVDRKYLARPDAEFHVGQFVSLSQVDGYLIPSSDKSDEIWTGTAAGSHINDGMLDVRVASLSDATPQKAFYKTCPDDTHTVNHVRRSDRMHWANGRTYAIQPGRGKKSVGRIKLTSIACERVIDITDEDAMLEGVLWGPDGYTFRFKGKEWRGVTANEAFRIGWKHLYPKSDLNELVWVLTFERVSP
jgi:hypothetical protein